MIARVCLISILFPTPYLPPIQPVLINQALEPYFLIFCPSISAYLEGCKVKNAAPKQEEKVADGSVTPSSVPATLAVYPQEMIHSLLAGEFGNRWKNPESITS